MHMVKCLYCEQHFDRDTEEYEMPNGRRYAHKSCYEKYLQEKKEEKKQTKTEKAIKLVEKKNTSKSSELTTLKDYISELFRKKCNWGLITRELKKYEEEGMTLTGIQKTLYYWYELKKNPVSQAQGHLGIVPFVYSDALQYFKRLYEIEQKNKDKVYHNSEETVEVKVRKPSATVKTKKLFNIGE